MGGFAWVTLATNDSYSLGALVLGHSLKQAGTKHQLAVLVTPGVTNSMRQKLAGLFDLVEEVNVLDSKDEANLNLLKRPELGVTFTKLHCWRLTQFEKCVFLDADTLVLKNSDELFDREEFSAAPDVGWPDCFNSGVFVYKPSKETFDKLVAFGLAKGSFDGGDQGLLNLYFHDWAHKDISRHLPFVYNMCSTACYSYLPAFKQFGTDVQIIHFIGATKPWLQYFNTESKQVQPGGDMQHLKEVLQRWWDIFCTLVHSNLSAEMCLPAGISPITHCHNEDHIVVWDPWEDYQPDEQDTQFESHNTNAPHPIVTEQLQLSVPHLLNIPKEKPLASLESLPVLVPENVHPALNKTKSTNNSLHSGPVQDDSGGHSTTSSLTSSSASSPPTVTSSNSPYELVNIADTEDAVDGGLAGAFAQFNLGAPRSQDQTELEEHLRRQSWEAGTIDYMGRDAFDRIWSKISETIATPPETGAKEGAEDAKPVESAEDKPASGEKKPEENAAAKEEVKEAAPVVAETTPVVPSPEPIVVDVKQAEVSPAEEKTMEEAKVEVSKAEAKVKAPEVETTKLEETKPESPKVEETKGDVPKIPEVGPVVVAADVVKPDTETPKAQVEAIKIGKAKQETPKLEESEAEAPKMEEVKAEVPKEETKIEVPEEAKPETPKVEEPKVETAKVEETKPEATKAEEPKVDAPKTEEAPKTEGSMVESPKLEEIKDSKVDTPRAYEVKPEELKQEPPKIEELKSTSRAPKVEEVKSEPLKTEEAKAEASKTEEAKEIVPKVEAPTVSKTEEGKTDVSEVAEATPEIPKPVEGIQPVEVVAEVKTDAPVECKPCDKSQEVVAEKLVEICQKPEIPASVAEEPTIGESLTVCAKTECTEQPAECPKVECPLKAGEKCSKEACATECPKKCPIQEAVPETTKQTEVAPTPTSDVPQECPKQQICPKECSKSEAVVETSKLREVVPASTSDVSKECPKECLKQETPAEISKTVTEEPQKVETPTSPAAATPAEATSTPGPTLATTPEKKESPKLDTSATTVAQPEVPATPEVIAPTPPTTPVATSALPAEAVALEAQIPAPETPPPVAESGERGQGTPVPPPRKSSGAKKPRKK